MSLTDLNLYATATKFSLRVDRLEKRRDSAEFLRLKTESVLIAQD